MNAGRNLTCAQSKCGGRGQHDKCRFADCCPRPQCKGWGGVCNAGFLRRAGDHSCSETQGRNCTHNDCCRQNCFSVHKAKLMTCAGGSERVRGEGDFHDPFGGDWSSQSKSQLQKHCCVWGRANCHTVMSSKGVSCDVGTLRTKDDWHMPWGNSWNEHGIPELKQQCCRVNCHAAMKAKALTCQSKSSERSVHDWHDPFGGKWNQSDAALQLGCCRQTCHTLMTAKKMSCGAGETPRSPTDMHEPPNRERDCSIKLDCCRNSCHAAMTARKLSCAVGRLRGAGDYHDPFGGSWNVSEPQLQEHCCQKNCFSEMGQRKLTCTAGAVMRGKDDWHSPFGDSTGSGDASTANLHKQCCRKNCNAVLAQKKLSCSVGEPRTKDDWHDPFGGDWDHQYGTDIKRECCRLNCHFLGSRVLGVRPENSSEITKITKWYEYGILKCTASF